MAGGRDGYEVCNDTIFIQGLPEDTTDEQLAEYFGQIGIIKFDKKNDCKKIWIYKDKASGKGKGEATITYDDPPTATSAIEWFNTKEFRGSKLKIELAQRKSTPQYGRGGGRGGGGGSRGGFGRGGYDRGGGGGDRGREGGGGYAGFRGERTPYDRDNRGGGGGGGGGRPGGPGGRPGDWTCPSCSNSNFAYRQECNRCKTQKPHGAGGGDGGSGGGGGRGGDRNHDHHHSGRDRYDSSSHGGRHERGGSDRHSDGRSFSRAQLVSRAQKLYRP